MCAIIGSEANEDAETFIVFIVPKMLKVTNKKVIDIEAQLGPFDWSLVEDDGTIVYDTGPMIFSNGGAHYEG